MLIERLLKDSKLGAEDVEILNRALDAALRALNLVDRGDPVTEIVARKIIEVGASGVRDPAEISRLTLRELRVF
jgi:hypothetical protein